MKKRLTLFTLVTLISLVLSQSLFAQTDTLEVYPTLNDDVVYLNDVIENNAGYKVYKLMSTDISYFYTKVTTLSTDFEIFGKVDPTTGRLPCIQPLELDDNSIADRVFNATADDITITFKNIYFLARSNANTIAPPPTPNSGDPDPGVISTNGNNLTLNIDNCVFDSWHHFSVYDNGSNNNFYFTNNIWRNFVQKGNHLWVGEVLRHLDPTTPMVMYLCRTIQ